MKNRSLQDELVVAERRLAAQAYSVADDKAFLNDKKLCEALPKTVASVRTRLKRNEILLAATQAIVDEIKRAMGTLKL